jgi:CHASE2 domain-containing sensor protein
MTLDLQMLSAKLISALFGQANQSGEKSTVVHTIIWLIAVITLGIVCLIYFNASSWVIATFLFIMVAGCIFYGAVFWHCLRNNPDLLRSEKMVLQKLAIEKQFLGDNITGEFEETPRPIGSSPEKKLIGRNIDGVEDK